MMRWSRYNTLQKTARNRFLAYNALSNTMLELDAEHFEILSGLGDNGMIGAGHDSEFNALLEEYGFMANPEHERLSLMTMRNKRNSIAYDSSNLSLTICPTLACNFTCPYCFEHSQGDMSSMSTSTQNALVDFIRSFENARKLNVGWYGGEPTLAFDTIVSLSAAFEKLDSIYESAGMVTNGYLLDRRKSEMLNDLKINHVQITLDGNRTTHDARRMLRGGQGTFDVILRNIETLLTSSYKGDCSVRVNIDRTNRDEFLLLHNELTTRLGKSVRLFIYPGRVENSATHSYGQQVALNTKEWSDFILDSYWNGGVHPVKGLYPVSSGESFCIANSQYGYVIGPQGELYKCWEDVGRDDLLAGSIADRTNLFSQDTTSRYMIGTDPYDNQECIDCSVFPICGGGCVNRRLRSFQFGESGLPICSPYKDSLPEHLEAYHDAWLSREVKLNLLSEVSVVPKWNGYRVIRSGETTDMASEPLKNMIASNNH